MNSARKLLHDAAPAKCLCTLETQFLDEQSRTLMSDDLSVYQTQFSWNLFPVFFCLHDRLQKNKARQDCIVKSNV